MIRRIAILRPEPGNAATTARVRDAGLVPLSLPSFDIAPLAWSAPGPGAFDGLLLTSANAIRHGGAGLAALTSLAVLAVGPATAAAARDAGFRINATGQRDVADLLDTVGGFTRLLWLTGRDRTAFDHPAIADVIAAYAADARPLSPEQAQMLRDSVVLLHSTRAAVWLTQELGRHGIARDAIRLVAISAKVATAAGAGWAAIATAAMPGDDSMIAAAHALAIDP